MTEEIGLCFSIQSFGAQVGLENFRVIILNLTDSVNWKCNNNLHVDFEAEK